MNDTNEEVEEDSTEEDKTDTGVLTSSNVRTKYSQGTKFHSYPNIG